MPDPIITLTTDFGEESPYVAAMKGVILGINPRARIVDLSHQIPPQDIHYAACFLTWSVPYFAPEVLHVVVVDPGVGSDRAVLYVEIGKLHRLLVPDNGCWTGLPNADPAGEVGPGGALAIRVSEPRFWRSPVSATFHGRDIFAPVAAHLSLGTPGRALGPFVKDWVRLKVRMPEVGADRVAGEVMFVDHFGNLITNIAGSAIAPLLPAGVRITVGGHEVPRFVRTYSEAEAGSVVALLSSSGGMMEVAVTDGSAARQLGVGLGSPVVVRRREAEARS